MAVTISSLNASSEIAAEMVAGGCSFELAVSQFLQDHRQRNHGRERVYARALAAFERPLLQMILSQAKGNQLQAAAILGINRNTLRKKLTEMDWRAGAAAKRAGNATVRIPILVNLHFVLFLQRLRCDSC